MGRGRGPLICCLGSCRGGTRQLTDAIGFADERRCASSGVLVPMHAMVPEGVEAEHGAGNMRNSIQFRWPDDLQRLFLQPVNPIF